jgi:hypothetical protein
VLLKQGGAIQSVDLTATGVSGVICSNCYAMLGATIGILLNYYSTGSIVNMEIIVKGSTAVHMDLNLVDPSVNTASSVTSIASGQARPSITETAPVYKPGGPKFVTEFMGLTAAVSGTTAATSNFQATLGTDIHTYVVMVYRISPLRKMRCLY